MFVATIGFFDGVHSGHRHLIGQVLKEAQDSGLQSMLITMDCHPKTIVDSCFVPNLLTTTDERIALLKATGADCVEILSFDHRMARMDAPTFMREILCRQLGVSALVMGYDHRFGHGGGSYEDYVLWGKECGIKVIKATQYNDVYASSSEIRKLLTDGYVSEAAKLLGYRYRLSGIVEKGHQVGRTLGFPTANLHVTDGKLIPGNGVYAVDTSLGIGIMNIGHRPTLNNGTERSIEVHIINYNGDLYGQTLQVWFIERIREERKFPSTEYLKKQIGEDISRASGMLSAPHKDM